MAGNRCFSVLLYPDSDSYDYESVLGKLGDAFEQFAYITHDRDFFISTDTEVKSGKHVEGELKKSHIHVVGRCSNPRTISSISKKLGIADNFIEYGKGTFKKAVRYLVHLDHCDKASYRNDEITSNFDHNIYLSILSQADMAKGILQIIDKGDVTSKRDLLNRCISEGLYSEYVRAYKLWMDIYLETKIVNSNNEWRMNYE